MREKKKPGYFPNLSIGRKYYFIEKYFHFNVSYINFDYAFSRF